MALVKKNLIKLLVFYQYHGRELSIIYILCIDQIYTSIYNIYIIYIYLYYIYIYYIFRGEQILPQTSDGHIAGSPVGDHKIKP